MQKQSVKFILIIIIGVVMLGIFKNLFGQKDNTELKEVLADNAYLVDVRTPSEFASGSVKGAVNIPLDKISGQLSKFKGKKNIVVFCRSGNRSSQAKSILEKNGFKNVVNGGTWQNVNSLISNN
ncbi:MAG: rhodanese-like domain-containing protein [Flavobacteriaceae bacterium]|jgi:rhodanese-related sulfurtransferase|uniref:Rhodanese-like domain-containing protein n=1 Tax=Galbibacter marinus TaxID=555500 RepID=K2PZS0_9FLAO|nr:rhodanese-like domain-containing protein [Galbibacter marinus]EKF54121.1 rhodanese-like domain-containing protein [Galbibacter marinus]NLN34293.1 rhodanese-like domain-containing protein [Flavobacteriaceae bacterium]